MAWFLPFPKRAGKSERRNSKYGLSPYLCRLGLEPLESRCLLSVVLPTGKGDWIHYLSTAETNLGVSSVQELFNYEASQGVQWVVVKAEDGSTTGSWGYSASVVTASSPHNAAERFCLGYIYRQFFWLSEAAELSTTLNIISSTSPDGFVIDAEAEYNNQPSAAAAYASGIKASYPNLLLAYSPLVDISVWPNYPYIQFGQYCDAVMPQAYFEVGPGYSPSGMVSYMDSQWSSWQNGLTGTQYAGSIKPIIPICQAYNDAYFTDNGTDLWRQFVNDLRTIQRPRLPAAIENVSFFDADAETSGMRTEIAAATIGFSAPILVGPGSSTTPGPTATKPTTFQWDQVTNATSYLLKVKDVTAGTGDNDLPDLQQFKTSYTLGLNGGDYLLVEHLCLRWLHRQAAAFDNVLLYHCGGSDPHRGPGSGATTRANGHQPDNVSVGPSNQRHQLLAKVKDVTAGTGITTYPISGGSTTSYTLELNGGDAYWWKRVCLRRLPRQAPFTTTYYFTTVAAPTLIGPGSSPLRGLRPPTRQRYSGTRWPTPRATRFS